MNPWETDDCRDQMQFYCEVTAHAEMQASNWICPYCGREYGEERARQGCCGEVHCVPLNSPEGDDVLRGWQ